MMNDLVYFGLDGKNHKQKFQDEIIKEFPDVVLSNADDDIKGYRTSVDLSSDKKDEYYAFIIGRGWWGCSLTTCIMEKTKEGVEYLETLLPILDKKYPKKEASK